MERATVFRPAAVLRRRCQQRAATPLVSASASAHPASKRSVEYTALEGNTFKLRLRGGLCVVADPWLSGPLTFGPPSLAWLYRGEKPSGERSLACIADAEVLLLAQGLDDHAHRPTLAALDKRLPVVASPSAAAVARELGFVTVHSLAHGESVVVRGVRFTATAGALVGPPWSTRENGFLITEEAPGGAVVYYDPHLDYTQASVEAVLRTAGVSRVDLAIVPTSAVSLAGYPLVLGSADAVMRLLRLIQPSVLLPLRNDLIKEDGAIAPLIQIAPSSLDALRTALAADAALDKRVRIVEPAEAGQALLIDV